MARRKERGRRRRGEGSVYKDRKTGGYIAQIHDRDGRLIRRRAPCVEAAEAALAELIRQREKGLRLDAGGQSLTDFMTTWFNEVARPNIKPKTAEHYQQMAELYILPALGDLRLDAIRPEDVLRFRNELQQRVSAQTTRHAFGVLRRALDVATEWRYIEFNPARVIKPPRVLHTEVQPLSVSESQALLRAVEGHRLSALYHAVLILGLRLGEVLGLRWADLNWEAGTIKVTQQVQGTGKTRIVAPKSAASARLLPLPPLLLRALRSHWQNQQEERALLGVEWKEHGLIFASERGTPLGPRNLERHWYGMRERAGIATSVTFHHLRHTVATRLDEAGASEAVKAAVLGHGKRSITQHYTHATIAAMRAAIEQVERVLGTNDSQNDSQQRSGGAF